MKIYWTLKSVPELTGLSSVQRRNVYHKSLQGRWKLALVGGLAGGGSSLLVELIWPINDGFNSLRVGAMIGFLILIHQVWNFNRLRPRMAQIRAQEIEKTPF